MRSEHEHEHEPRFLLSAAPLVFPSGSARAGIVSAHFRGLAPHRRSLGLLLPVPPVAQNGSLAARLHLELLRRSLLRKLHRKQPLYAILLDAAHHLLEGFKGLFLIFLER